MCASASAASGAPRGKRRPSGDLLHERRLLALGQAEEELLEARSRRHERREPDSRTPQRNRQHRDRVLAGGEAKLTVVGGQGGDAGDPHPAPPRRPPAPPPPPLTP